MNAYLVTYASFITCCAALLLWEVWRKTTAADAAHCDFLQAKQAYAKLAEKHNALLATVEGQKIRDTLRARQFGQQPSSDDRTEPAVNSPRVCG